MVFRGHVGHLNKHGRIDRTGNDAAGLRLVVFVGVEDVVNLLAVECIEHKGIARRAFGISLKFECTGFHHDIAAAAAVLHPVVLTGKGSPWGAT